MELVGAVHVPLGVCTVGSIVPALHAVVLRSSSSLQGSVTCLAVAKESPVAGKMYLMRVFSAHM